MNYLDVLGFPVNYVTARNVLALKGLREDVPNVVLRHDYDSLKNWRRVLEAERKCDVVSSNYLLIGKYDIPTEELKEYEQLGFEFGLHQNYRDSLDIGYEIFIFKGFRFHLSTMTPHGWAYKDGEYPNYGNWRFDHDCPRGQVTSLRHFYEFCHEHFGSYDQTYDVARFYSRSGKTFFEIPYKGVMLIDDSGRCRKPFTEENVMEHMEPSKVYVFLFHPENLTWRLGFKNRRAKWMSRMEWS